MDKFSKERKALYKKYSSKFSKDTFLSRKIVSFQANKTTPVYRWFKYKEGFSADLVKYYLRKFNIHNAAVLDPFAGTGTTMFASAELGYNSVGIELLPVGVFFMDLRKDLKDIDVEYMEDIYASLWTSLSQIKSNKKYINHVAITEGAFPEETELLLNKYLEHSKQYETKYKNLLQFIAYSVLESISYTRKDGQFLRWDYRSKRNRGKTKFDKGKILSFKEAIDIKFKEVICDLRESIEDLTMFPEDESLKTGNIEILQGSCLTKLPEIQDNSIDIIITSPPYCNRYDYTRTYALELVFLGADNDDIKNLRQSMLSCTVENKSKVDELRTFYESRGMLNAFENINDAYNSCKAMTEVNLIMEKLLEDKKLNNSGLTRMVKNYFLEMCFTIYELSRVLKKGGRVIMVNDNVQYNGEEIPVDLILSEFAEKFGIQTEAIYVLQQNKGNSSQQMGSHGRTPIRKCVYSWVKQ